MAEATATTLPFFLSLVSLHLIIISNGVHSFEHKTFKLNLNVQRKHTLGCLLPQSRREKGAIILEMKERGHYCWEKSNSADWNRRVERELAGDVLRVRAIQNRIGRLLGTASESQITIPVSSGMKFQTLNYVVTVGLGDQNVSMIVDTGSDLTWVQCQPCYSCYPQQGPLFDPSASPSFQSILCNSTTCQSLPSSSAPQQACASTSSSSSSSSCNYVVNYGDGSYTSGELGVEHLSFGGGVSVSNNFVFGCGRNNKGLFGVASGLMGLGRSNLSLISQTDAAFGGVFSYCLPSPEAGGSGSLVMGNGNDSSSATHNVTPIAYTRMLPNPSFYMLNLTGISVGGVALQASSGLGKGVLIDSGTVITRLAPSIYKAVRAEFVKQVSLLGYPWAPGFSILDTCFNLTGYDEVNVPSLRMFFEGAELDVDVAGMFYLVKEDASRVCLAITSLSHDYETAIVGNYQQRNQRVIYDTKYSRLGFAAEPCTFT